MALSVLTDTDVWMSVDVWRKDEEEYLLCICYVVEAEASQVAQW